MATERRLVKLIQENLRLITQRQRLADDEPIVTLQVGKQVFENAPRQMRVELWKSSLQRRGVGVAAAKSYEDLLQGEVSEEAAGDIQKDLARTFPGTKRFASAEGQAALRRVLRAYAALDPEVGYCQGMNFVAALLLTYLPEPEAFGALVVLMQDRGLRRYYSTDMALLQAHLWQLGRLMPPALCAHLESCGILPSLYAASWLMTCYSADFPTSFSARIMDVILSEKMDQALLKVAVTLLGRSERRLMASDDLEDVLSFLKQDMTGWDEQSLHDILSDAFKKPWTPRQQALLSSMEGAETVAEAQDRVSKANLAAAAAAAGGEGADEEEEAVSSSPSAFNSSGGAGGAGAGAAPGAGTASARAGAQRASDGASGGGLVLPPPPNSPVRFAKAGFSFKQRNVSPGASSGGSGWGGGSGPPSPGPGGAGGAAAAAGAFGGGGGCSVGDAGAAEGAAAVGGADLHDLLGDWQPFEGVQQRGPGPSHLRPHHQQQQQHPQQQHNTHHHAFPRQHHPHGGMTVSASAPAMQPLSLGLTTDSNGRPGAVPPQRHQAAAAAAAAADADSWGEFVSSPHVEAIPKGSSGNHAAISAAFEDAWAQMGSERPAAGSGGGAALGGGGGGSGKARQQQELWLEWQCAAGAGATTAAAHGSEAAGFVAGAQVAATSSPSTQQQQQHDPFIGSPWLGASTAACSAPLAAPSAAAAPLGIGGATAISSRSRMADPFGDWHS